MKAIVLACLSVLFVGCQYLPTLPVGVVGVNMTYTIAEPKPTESTKSVGQDVEKETIVTK